MWWLGGAGGDIGDEESKGYVVVVVGGVLLRPMGEKRTREKVLQCKGTENVGDKASRAEGRRAVLNRRTCCVFVFPYHV